MYCRLARLTVASCIVVALGSTRAPAAAQALVTNEDPFPGFERTERDLGTWDAVLAGHDRVGRPLSVHFVETNTTSRGETGVRTRLDTSSPLVALSTPGPWWTVLQMGPGVAALRSDLSNSARLGSSFDGVQPVVALRATSNGRKAVLVDPSDSWIDIDHPSVDRRVVTVFGRTASGEKIQLLRIVYTRRH